MSDSSASHLFSRVFLMISEEISDPEKRTRVARDFWAMTSDYDFSWSEMECDDVLIRLGLARRGVDPDYPEEGEVIIYYGEDAF